MLLFVLQPYLIGTGTRKSFFLEHEIDFENHVQSPFMRSLSRVNDGYLLSNQIYLLEIGTAVPHLYPNSGTRNICVD